MRHQTDSNQLAVEAVGLCKSYSGRAVLRSVDLQISRGETVAVMGCNGAGKTTLLACAAGVMRPDGGTVRWFGKSASGSSEARRCVGLSMHQSQLYANLTIYENLLFAARMCEVRRPHEAVQTWIGRMELNRAATLNPTQVSHGMRRRAAIARSLIHDPSIVLLDEPFSGLDDRAKSRLLELLQRLRDRGCGICFSTHDAALATMSADTLLRLEEGRAVKVSEAGKAPTKLKSRTRVA